MLPLGGGPVKEVHFQMKVHRLAALALGLAGTLVLTPATLLAYGGPGSLVTGIGALLAALAALAAAVFGFVWFPVKRLIRHFRGDEEEGTGDVADTT